ncbi:hypothetical protein T484DRAFT_2308213 [Baffinella frigidus]|nr:hypothetical protein T484DRAFT_2308213 [Cryptophyta sp. CCMP2293]
MIEAVRGGCFSGRCESRWGAAMPLASRPCGAPPPGGCPVGCAGICPSGCAGGVLQWGLFGGLCEPGGALRCLTPLARRTRGSGIAALDLYWRPSDSDDLWYKSRDSKRRFAPTLRAGGPTVWDALAG